MFFFSFILSTPSTIFHIPCNLPPPHTSTLHPSTLHALHHPPLFPHPPTFIPHPQTTPNPPRPLSPRPLPPSLHILHHPLSTFSTTLSPHPPPPFHLLHSHDYKRSLAGVFEQEFPEADVSVGFVLQRQKLCLGDALGRLRGLCGGGRRGGA